MPHTIVFRSEARDEALNAAGYIAEHGSPGAAQRWYEGLEAAVASLASMPARCGYARENESFRGVELRQLVYKSHRLIFTVRGDEVHVLHVRHVARTNLDDISEITPGGEV